MKRSWILPALLAACGAPPPAPPESAPTPAATAEGWTTLPEALASGRPVLIFFTSAGDEPCATFESEVLGDEEVLEALKGFARVRLDAFPRGGGRDAEFAKHGFAGVPAIVVMSASGKVVAAKEYAVSRTELHRLLEEGATGE